MPLILANHMFTTSLPDINGNIMIVCVTDPKLSFTIDLGSDSLNNEAIRYFDRIMLSTTTPRYQQAHNPEPLISAGNIASMKFTNVQTSFTIYWSSIANNDKVVVTDVLGNKLLERTGLTIGNNSLRNFLVENFPLRIRINTSSLQNQYEAILTVAENQHGNAIDSISHEEIDTNTDEANRVLMNIDEVINNLARQYNFDIDALTERFVGEDDNEDDDNEIPPAYTPFITDDDCSGPPSYNSIFA